MNMWKAKHRGQTFASTSCRSQKNKQPYFTCVLTFLWLQIQKESLHPWGLLATHWRCGHHREMLHSLLEPPQDSHCETVQPWNQIRWLVVPPALLSLLSLHEFQAKEKQAACNGLTTWAWHNLVALFDQRRTWQANDFSLVAPSDA